MSTETRTECEGACEQHAGEVRRVLVHGWITTPVEFNYCAVAIEEDQRRGFTVEPRGETDARASSPNTGADHGS